LGYKKKEGFGSILRIQSPHTTEPGSTLVQDTGNILRKAQKAVAKE